MTGVPSDSPAVRARRRHYADFYDPSRLAAAIEAPLPVLLVLGNCQAESLRILLDGPVATLRIPPVHELAPDEVPTLHRIIGAVDILVCQPVRDGYRGLLLGSAETAALMRTDSHRVLVPVLRDTGLFPDAAIVRDPRGELGDPPLVPYHDLRTLVAAAGGSLPDPDATAIRAEAESSLEELRARERAHGTVVISDVVAERTPESFHTINHPGNAVLRSLADRVRDRLGGTERSVDPGRALLGGLRAPLTEGVIDALGLDGAARPDWETPDGTIPVEQVRSAHLRWYRDHPRVIDAGLARHASRLERRGWRR